MNKLHHFIAMIIIAVIALPACNLPSRVTPTPNTNVVFTAAALTVEARLTQSAPLYTSTPVMVVSTNTNTSLPPPTLALTNTPLPINPTATQECDKAYGGPTVDVTVPDGTVFEPDKTFTKTWRLKNIGTCTWTSAYAIVFGSGDAMGGPASLPLTGNVTPGQTIDISIDLKAPTALGDYKGYWKLRNSAGVLFATVWVQIKVATSSSGFDLYTRAESAEWTSCDSPCVGVISLSFGGPDNDPDGFVMYRSGLELEDGSIPSRILETHPKWVNDGSIRGLFPIYKVLAGDHLVTKLGFLAKANGTCGTGDVIFKIMYKESGATEPMGSWSKTCDGTLESVDIDLSSLVGHSVQFELVVLANGSAGQDWAVWVNPKVTP